MLVSVGSRTLLLEHLKPWRGVGILVLLTLLAIAIHNILSAQKRIRTSSPSALKLSFTYLGLCESECESIKNNFTDGLVSQFLFEWSPNDRGKASDRTLD